MLSYQERCTLDASYKEIIEKVGACYVQLVKVSPDDYNNDFAVGGYIDKVKDVLDNIDQDNSVESDDPTTTADDIYTIPQVVATITDIIAAYDELNTQLAESADMILEKGVFTDLKELLFPYNK